MILVVDASAAVEFLLRTELGQALDGLLGDAELAAPELLDTEVLAVLRREVLARRLRGHVSAYDALYVAAARLRQANLVTADGPLSRASRLGVAVQNVRL